ncbi:MAG: OmpA family protein [Magnetococcus sp. DMHC-6]
MSIKLNAKTRQNRFMFVLAAISIMALLTWSRAAFAFEPWEYNGWTQWHPQKGHGVLSHAGTQFYFPIYKEKEVTPPPVVAAVVEAKAPVQDPDSDLDGVVDSKDKCPGTPRGAPVNADGCWVINNVLFDFDRSAVKADYKPGLDVVSDVMKKNPDLKMQLNGHTDIIGKEVYNNKLSVRRSKRVMEYMVKKGLEAGRFEVQGFGYKNPVADNATKEGRALNRRVELTPQ